MVDPNYGSWSVEEGLEYMDFCVFAFSITPVLHYSTTPGSSFPLPAVRCLLKLYALCLSKSAIRNPKSEIPLPINIRENVVNGSDGGDQVGYTLTHSHKRHYLYICKPR